jgi:hypothetical protein
MNLISQFSFSKWWVSPYINHFVSADSIVPGYGNPQALNRYAYTLNNPLRYTDPTGHTVDCNPMEDDCHHDDPSTNSTGDGNGQAGNHHNDDGGDDPDPTNGLIVPAQSSVAPTVDLSPDYYVGSLFIPVYLPFPLFGIDITVVRDTYGNWYGNLGVGVSWGPSVSGGGGWLLGPDNDHEHVVEGFLQGHSFNVSGGFILGIGENNVNPSYIRANNENPRREDNAIEALVTSPGVTAVASYGWMIYDHGDDTPWIWQGD